MYNKSNLGQYLSLGCVLFIEEYFLEDFSFYFPSVICRIWIWIFVEYELNQCNINNTNF